MKKLGLLPRLTYLAQSHKLCRAKADEFKLVITDVDLEEEEVNKITQNKLVHYEDRTLHVSVWARAWNDNPEIWNVVDRYGNNLVFDEDSMMSCEARFDDSSMCFMCSM